MGSMLDEALKGVREQGGVEPALAPVRGLRDFLPEEQSERQRVMQLLRATFERYGFLPLETPALESWGVLSSKDAGGSEILKETYGLRDQGDRRLGLRYDLTVPLCRVVANNPNLPKPFKRYQIAPVWRDGPITSVRFREFVQCDVDTVGAPFGLADAEVLSLAADAYAGLGLDVQIRVNDRKLLDGLLAVAGVPDEKRLGAMLSLDKLEKIGLEGVVKELQEERNLPLESINALVGILTELQRAKGDEETLAALERKLAGNERALEGLRELRDLFAFLSQFGAKVRESIKFDPLLARGLNYYTGPVFEAYLRDGETRSAVGAGGRYDDLIGAFAGRGEKVPAVGFSFGLDVIAELLSKRPGTKPSPGVVKVFTIPIGGEAVPKSVEYTQRLRRAGLNAAMDLLGRGVTRNIEYAVRQGARYCLIVGSRELSEGKVTLRNLESGEERVIGIEVLLELLTDEQALGKL